jgi:hypothetical protein
VKILLLHAFITLKEFPAEALAYNAYYILTGLPYVFAFSYADTGPSLGDESPVYVFTTKQMLKEALNYDGQPTPSKLKSQLFSYQFR